MDSASVTGNFLSPNFFVDAGKLIYQHPKSSVDPALFVIGESRSGKSTLINAVRAGENDLLYRRSGAEIILREGGKEDAKTGGGISGVTLAPEQFEGFLGPDKRKVIWVDTGGVEDHNEERRILISLSTKALSDRAENLKLILTFSYSTLKGNAFIEKLRKRVITICRMDEASVQSIFLAFTHPPTLRSHRRVTTDDARKKLAEILSSKTFKNTPEGNFAWTILNICCSKNRFAVIDPADNNSIKAFKDRVAVFVKEEDPPPLSLGHSFGQNSWMLLAESLNKIARKLIYDLKKIQELKIRRLEFLQEGADVTAAVDLNKRRLIKLTNTLSKHVEEGNETVKDVYRPSGFKGKSSLSKLVKVIKSDLDCFIKFSYPFAVDEITVRPAGESWMVYKQIIEPGRTDFAANLSQIVLSKSINPVIKVFYKKNATPEWQDKAEHLNLMLLELAEERNSISDELFKDDNFLDKLDSRLEKLQQSYNNQLCNNNIRVLEKLAGLIGFNSITGESDINLRINLPRVKEVCGEWRKMFKQIERNETIGYRETVRKILKRRGLEFFGSVVENIDSRHMFEYAMSLCRYSSPMDIHRMVEHFGILRKDQTETSENLRKFEEILLYAYMRPSYEDELY